MDSTTDKQEKREMITHVISLVQPYRDKVLTIVAFLIGLLATTPLIRVGGFSLYLWLVGAMTVLLVCRWRLEPEDICLLFVLLCTVLLTYGSLSQAYRSEDRNGFIELLLAILLGRALVIHKDGKPADAVVNGVVFASKVQVVWIFLQVACWSCVSLDINDEIFHKLLNMKTVASQFKASGFVATGLCWNAGGIAACLIVGYMLEKRMAWKIAILAAGILTQSSTVWIGLFICIVYGLYRRILKSDKSVNWYKIGAGAVIGALVCVLVFIFVEPVRLYTINLVNFMVGRISGIVHPSSKLDSSSTAHLAYYMNIPALLSKMSLLQLLFGYGINCSGLPYTDLTQQYFWIKSWFVESDPVNTLLGTGIVGSILLVYWLYRQVCRSVKVHNHTAAIIVVLLICGFFYNLLSVAYYWLILVIVCLPAYEESESIDKKRNSACRSPRW